MKTPIASLLDIIDDYVKAKDRISLQELYRTLVMLSSYAGEGIYLIDMNEGFAKDKK